MENHRTRAFASKFCQPPRGSLASGRDDIRAVDLPRLVIAFEPHDFVRPVVD
jgi:hypothetical protein